VITLARHEDEEAVVKAIEMAYPKSDGRKIFNRYRALHLERMIEIALEFGTLKNPVSVSITVRA